MEYISREAAIEAARIWNGDESTGAWIQSNLGKLPAADVRPAVRARWIDTDNYYQRWKCSACGCHTRDAAPDFCPNCWADMRGES